MPKSKNPSEDFIQGWLDMMGIHYAEEVSFGVKKSLDFVITALNTGIYIPNWKKPISVKVVNTALDALKELGLTKIYVIANEVSHYVQELMNRIEDPIIILDNFSLTEVYMELNQLRVQREGRKEGRVSAT